MTPERWSHIGELFDELLALSAAERERRLAALAAGSTDDVAAIAEVRSLLDAADAAEGEQFLSRSPTLPASLFEATPVAGDRLGPYQLEAEVGHGGMGTVYRAHRADGAFAKQVAIKLVRRGMDTELVVRRFLAEREILAGLEHPHIARLLDGGQSDDGRPYFVMELVEGAPLDRWCARTRPPLARRLAVFLAICDAVQHAHRSLVIHRDLKPANVLVRDDGVAKLLDFGIAKLLVPGHDATAGELLATPQYASPEQLRGAPITTSTDIHGLGLLLYVLLVGRPPFEGGEEDEPAALVRRICDEPPPRPSAASGDRAQRGDLDTIVAMALRKEPERRYATVGELADDVRRHLAGRPVRARGDSLGYRAGRFALRAWIPLTAAALVLAALVAGIVATRRQAEVARHERGRAERRLGQVRELTGTMIFELDDAIAALTGANPARQVLVARALTFLDQLAAEGDRSAAVARELAIGYRKLGDIQGSPGHSNLGDLDGAAASYAKALVACGRWRAAVPPADAAVAVEHARILDRQAALRGFVDDNAGAERLERAALETLAAVPVTLDGEYMRVGVLASLGDALLGQARRDEALPYYEQALALAARIAESGQAADRQTLSATWIKMGDVRRSGGDVAGAGEAYRTALALRERLASEAPDSGSARRDLSLALSRVVKVHKLQEDRATALEFQARALALDEIAVAADPSDVRAQRDLASSLIELAQLHDALGDAGTGEAARAHWLAARAAFVRALEVTEKLTRDGGATAGDASLPAALRARIVAVDQSLAAGT